MLAQRAVRHARRCQHCSLARSTGVVGGGPNISQNKFSECAVTAMGARWGKEQQARFLSDNLLGHSPMAPGAQATTTTKKSTDATDPAANPMMAFGTSPISTDGGVWSSVSSKRNKLAELRGELDTAKGERTLDDAATPEQLLDLYLVDGLNLIVKSVEQTWDRQLEQDSAPTSDDAENVAPGAQKATSLSPAFDEWMGFLSETSNDQDLRFLNRVDFDLHLSEATRRLPSVHDFDPPIAATSFDQGGASTLLARVRYFVEKKEENEEETVTETTDSDEPASTDDLFDRCTDLYRLFLLRATVDHLKAKWDDLIKVTDGDIDRAAMAAVADTSAAAAAATTEEASQQNKGLSRRALNAVLQAFTVGSCDERLEAMWNLVDRDGDGLLDQTEMDKVVHLCLTPVEQSLQELFHEAVEASPIRDFGDDATAKKSGFWTRRREAAMKRRLKRMLRSCIRSHFYWEIEMPHRLRCVYAWAEKAHQDGNVDSVLIPGAGRQRYVELPPKIAHAEFREMQKMQFPHVGRVGEEILLSFRDDLLVDQGTKRQNRELRRNSVLFVLAVGIIDLGIMLM